MKAWTIFSIVALWFTFVLAMGMYRLNGGAIR